MKYRPEIDGLRAVAVLPVILFHAGFSRISGGFLGVDIFFVISGFLITSIILSALDKDEFSLSSFYVRRIKRIIPALFVVCVTSWVMALLWLTPHYMVDFSKSLMTVATFSSNFLFWRDTGYFDTAAELKPLLHTWSLAVEEQYYILFPLGLLLFKRVDRRVTFYLIVAATVASLFLSHWAAYNKPVANFFLLPTRGWQILLGSCLAFYQNLYSDRREKNLRSEILSVLGGLFILCGFFVLDKDTPLPSLYALLPTVGALLIIAYTAQGGIMYKILSNPACVGLGVVSYSAYLWHQPLFSFARYNYGTALPVWIMTGLSVASFALAYLSWRFVENPFRFSKVIDARRVFSWCFASLLLLLAVGFFGYTSKGFDSLYQFRLSPEDRQAYRFVKEHTVYDVSESMRDDGKCNFWSITTENDIDDRFDSCFEEFGPAVIVVGDSHAKNLYNIIVEAGMHSFVVGIVQGGCQVFKPKRKCHYNAFKEFMKINGHKVSYVLLHQSGSHLIVDKDGSKHTQRVFNDGEDFHIRHDYIDSIIDYLQEIRTYAPTYWVGHFPEGRLDFYMKSDIFRDQFMMRERGMFVLQEVEKQALLQLSNSEIKETVDYVSLMEWMDTTERSIVVGDCLLYRNADHFSHCGENHWGKKLQQRFKQFHKDIISSNKGE